jgi:hypothetical protein
MSGEAVLYGPKTAITVTWMDGKVQVYRYPGVSKHRVENGVLTIDESRGSAGPLHLPLTNIREIAVEVDPGGLRRS